MFCVSSYPGGCGTGTNVDDNTSFNGNVSPWIVGISRPNSAACESWKPAVHLLEFVEVDGVEGLQKAWYVGETVYWTAMACATLLNGQRSCYNNYWHALTTSDF